MIINGQIIFTFPIIKNKNQKKTTNISYIVFIMLIIHIIYLKKIDELDYESQRPKRFYELLSNSYTSTYYS